MEKYIERASQLHRIMSNPVSKKAKEAGELSLTAKGRVLERYNELNYGIYKNIDNKFTLKGTQLEDESILLFKKVFGEFSLFKNEKNFKDEYFTGTPDLITDDLVIDIKTKYSLDGFQKMYYNQKPVDKAYIYQIQCYMHLLGLKRGMIAFCLTNNSEEGIVKEIQSQIYKSDKISYTDSEYLQIEEKVRKEQTFDYLPDNKRVKMIFVDYNEDLIVQMKERIKQCDKYYKWIDTYVCDNLEKSLVI
jgi:hypothetical protein|tara:strand:- start:9307 stop:10047 length:741 start_codon:yes stop_codon:yes gene_type:complete